MKYLTHLAVVAAVGAVAFGAAGARERAIAADGDVAPAFAYRIVTLNNPHTAVQQNVLNQWAGSGWELITVDERQAYFKKRIR